VSSPIYCSRHMAALVLDKNVRTIKRWCEEGVLEGGPQDASGRSTVSLSDVMALLGDLSDLELPDLILQADLGNASAQSDLAMVFLQEGRANSAFELFQEAAKKDYPDAMHWLYRCYREGLGVERDENLAMMWLHKAAAHGHVIAKAQTEALRGLAVQQLQAEAASRAD